MIQIQHTQVGEESSPEILEAIRRVNQLRVEGVRRHGGKNLGDE